MMMLDGTKLPDDPSQMSAPPLGDGGAKSAARGVAALPATAQICSCNSVTQGRALRRRRCGLHDARGAQDGHAGGDIVRRLQFARRATAEG